jgi:hypothetical protein
MTILKHWPGAIFAIICNLVVLILAVLLPAIIGLGIASLVAAYVDGRNHTAQAATVQQLMADYAQLQLQFDDANTGTGIPVVQGLLAHEQKPDMYSYPFVADSSGLATIDGLYTAVKTDDGIMLTPNNYQLYQNFPNPFNPSTALQFITPEAGDVSIYITNVNGQLVKQLVGQQLPAGTHTVNWNGNNNNETGCAAGIYFATMVAGDYTKTIKLVKADGGGSDIDETVSTSAGNHGSCGLSIDQVASGEYYRLEADKDGYDSLSISNILIEGTGTIKLTYQMKPVHENQAPTLHIKPDEDITVGYLNSDSITIEFDISDPENDNVHVTGGINTRPDTTGTTTITEFTRSPGTYTLTVNLDDIQIDQGDYWLTGVPTDAHGKEGEPAVSARIRVEKNDRPVYDGTLPTQMTGSQTIYLPAHFTDPDIGDALVFTSSDPGLKITGYQAVYDGKQVIKATITATDKGGLEASTSELEFRPALVTLEGKTIHYTDDEPVQGLQVKLTNNATGQEFYATTDVQGQFRIDAPKGNYKLEIYDETEECDVTAQFSLSNLLKIGQWYDIEISDLALEKNTSKTFVMIDEKINPDATKESEAYENFQLQQYKDINTTDIAPDITRFAIVNEGGKILVYLNRENAEQYCRDDYDPNVNAADLYMEKGRAAMDSVNSEIFVEIQKDQIPPDSNGVVIFDYSTLRNKTVHHLVWNEKDNVYEISKAEVYIDNSMEPVPQRLLNTFEHELQWVQGFQIALRDAAYEYLRNFYRTGAVPISDIEQNWSAFHNNIKVDKKNFRYHYKVD